MYSRITAAVCRWLAATLSATGLVLAIASTGHADPSDNPPPPSPYPKADAYLTAYNRLEPDQFFIRGNYGVFFLTPTGLNCGIWLKGAFGCSGVLPGAPPGADHIGWFNGEPRVHYDWTAAIQFPAVQAQQVLPPRSYVKWNETTCVTMADSSTYCVRGEFRFFITDAGTWLNG